MDQLQDSVRAQCSFGIDLDEVAALGGVVELVARSPVFWPQAFSMVWFEGAFRRFWPTFSPPLSRSGRRLAQRIRRPATRVVLSPPPQAVAPIHQVPRRTVQGQISLVMSFSSSKIFIAPASRRKQPVGRTGSFSENGCTLPKKREQLPLRSNPYSRRSAILKT